MDKIENVQSGADYAKLIIDSIILEEDKLTNDKKLPLYLLGYWCEEIENYADKTWQDYILGKRETFIFDEDEMDGLYNRAGMQYTSDILEGLIDTGMVEMGVREDGEIVYKTTDKGNEELKKDENKIK
jgi:hypothetical protein